MKIITHENLWWWGKSYTLILDNGKAMIEVSIEDERPDAACIQSLLVHESVRQQGIANAMLTFAEDKAKKAGCEQVYLCARKARSSYLGTSDAAIRFTTRTPNTRKGRRWQ